MARLKNIFFLLVFCLFFILGLSIGKMMEDKPALTTEPQIQITQPQNEENYLIIGVDDLSNPIAKLESAWLVTLKSDSAQIVLHPLYPIATAPYLRTYLSPHLPILVSTTRFDMLSEVEVIHKQGASWSGVIMHDLVGLNIIVEIAGGRHNFQSDSDDLKNPNLPKPWEDPEDTLQKQKNVITFLCEHSRPFTIHNNIEYLISYIPDHFKSTLSNEDLWRQWQLLSNIHLDLSCHYSW